MIVTLYQTTRLASSVQAKLLPLHLAYTILYFLERMPLAFGQDWLTIKSVTQYILHYKIHTLQYILDQSVTLYILNSDDTRGR